MTFHKNRKQLFILPWKTFKNLLFLLLK